MHARELSKNNLQLAREHSYSRTVTVENNNIYISFKSWYNIAGFDNLISNFFY